jgi:hypothetical protein
MCERLQQCLVDLLNVSHSTLYRALVSQERQTGSSSRLPESAGEAAVPRWHGLFNHAFETGLPEVPHGFSPARRQSTTKRLASPTFDYPRSHPIARSPLYQVSPYSTPSVAQSFRNPNGTGILRVVSILSGWLAAISWIIFINRLCGGVT